MKPYYKNDTRSCHHTPPQGLIAYQENVDDWKMLGRAYATAAKRLRASEGR